ncbi:MAG: Type II secretory pathway component [Gammaproteobacteria bacterium]|nr:Type II secretory pathway component [Gammaproteobacteria bacterium]MBU2158534.1 Type II secretory pathway component [Gammaproteobacteria bacterium]MBU2254763.1 Type II secretory pathway component [Gammaproteobacteria bacterium]
MLSSAALAGNPRIDPTQPPSELLPAAVAASGSSPLVLQAIVRSAQGSRAIIAGQSVRVGERYADARVLAIHAQSVLIERQGQQQLLRLVEPVMQPSRCCP